MFGSRGFVNVDISKRKKFGTKVHTSLHFLGIRCWSRARLDEQSLFVRSPAALGSRLASNGHAFILVGEPARHLVEAADISIDKRSTN
ncbi:uncharacterized protein PHALS_06501 [Plasmopara halstedii]|uniref:Uncharacterized protein n=1 Tax=Plasmopara halstedii TaxID=4781 RepID=A0A0P1B3C7_PLAHL|nr:uncharacterized protein PHALS_02887 [Plasmopara halstedii]XP_024584494.1 uncharacterized protein PHALS_05598 [Plasmopara halstedii]XP_024585059.1 uncharacterized protein PHALS_06501 [Plasmopara halstedii]CEG46487.1 hypothetical protein PHALS_02887 [Plasmopara halstedii]CEG48125.1 hypothetical protein PHALS_05598 [Plasmopara halstedii]CEG48690.1 hypothetical protein PHALS_06501 [Plasmopara halstedii]|eukprot:XP_024582856.1 hypothetical protein PHALS_02887 [Plasmopara halstedii]